jgi:hypothetical protein
LAVAAIVGLFVISGALSAKGNSAAALEHAKAVQEQHTNRLMAIKGVVGTAVGSDQDNAPVVLVLVEKAGLAGIPNKLDGVPVRPMVTGKINALVKPDAPPGKPPKPDPDPEPDPEPVDPTIWFERPVPIGVSTGHPDITAGTIGCRVTDGANVYALSNNHVYANENLGVKNVDPVLQPGPFDGGGKVEGRDDAIGTLVDFEPIEFGGPDNTIDAAIAISSTNLLGNATPADGYGTPKSQIVAPALRLKLQKYGRTTGLTAGKITAINATVNVAYDSGVARFVDQIIIIPGGFSAGGDSGSLVVTQKGSNPVGLLFAGSPTITIATPIGTVLDILGDNIDATLSIDGQ